MDRPELTMSLVDHKQTNLLGLLQLRYVHPEQLVAYNQNFAHIGLYRDEGFDRAQTFFPASADHHSFGLRCLGYPLIEFFGPVGNQ